MTKTYVLQYLNEKVIKDGKKDEEKTEARERYLEHKPLSWEEYFNALRYKATPWLYKI